MRRFLTTGLLLFLIPLSLQAQLILQLKSRKTDKVHERYYPGNSINFYINGHPDEISGTIDSISGDAIYVADIEYSLAAITRVIVRSENCNWRMSGANLMLAGALYPGIEAFNTWNIYGEPTVSRSTVIVSAVLLTTGYILYRIGKRTFIIGGKYYLKTI